MEQLELYHFCNESNTFSVVIDRSQYKFIQDFVLRIRESFEVSEDSSFILVDQDGDVVVVSDALYPANYVVRVIEKGQSIRSIIQNNNSSDQQCVDNNYLSSRPNVSRERDVNGVSFETNLIRVACADSMIANERTWLAWTRTSLNIMTCCFTFAFLDDWSEESTTKRIVSNICVVAFAICFAGCFIVGYFRYTNLSSLLRDRTAASRFADLDVDEYHLHKIWAYFLGITLVFSSVVFIFVLKETADSDVSVD